eukprot:m.472160 g.472160  ORF g.472160 m.472160 type:complete len:129 (-) comp21660_c0_seq16:994-1380(-)
MTRVERQCPASVINTVGGDAAYVILQVWMVDFSAGPWCGPCTDALRELKTVARQIGNMARIGYVNCDLHHEFCAGHNVDAFPDIRVWRAGKKKLSDGGQRYTDMAWADFLLGHLLQFVPNKVASSCSA